MDSSQSEIRELLDRRSGAMQTKDIDRLMSLYADDIVYFDLAPPALMLAAHPAGSMRA